jgi:hypothetical protein
MKIDELRARIHAVPFQPFTVHTADGRSIPVPHPDFIAIAGTGRTAFITFERKPSLAVVDVPLITQLEVQGDMVDRD